MTPLCHRKRRTWRQYPFWTITLLHLLSVTDAWSTTNAFSTFQFAPNGVCTSPKQFTDGARRFTLKNVPGEGDCVFLAVALASLTSIGIGGNDVLLRAISKETRNNVASILEQGHGNLVIEGRRLVSAKRLLQSASKQEGLTEGEYLRQLRLEGRDGGLYGGGPELTVLSNLLRRPISIYELNHSKQDSEPESMPIVCKGTFGRDFFRDALRDVPESAIFQQKLPGAFHWHLHILIVNSSSTEKHACVLLPQH